MQELLAKIIETDAKARRIKEQAEHDKLSSEAEIEELRQKIYDDYIARAKDRVEKNISIDRHNAEEEYAEKLAEAQRIKDAMQQTYAQHRQEWIDGIVSRVIAGSSAEADS